MYKNIIKLISGDITKIPEVEAIVKSEYGLCDKCMGKMDWIFGETCEKCEIGRAHV